jgi:hypothetical protein
LIEMSTGQNRKINFILVDVEANAERAEKEF